MPDEVEEFWDDIRPGRFELPEVDQGVIARALQDGVDPRIVSRAQSMAEADVREIRDIIQAVRGVPSWRNVSAENRRGFLILLQEEMAERRRRGLPPIPITYNGFTVRPGETLEEFHIRCEVEEGDRVGMNQVRYGGPAQFNEPRAIRTETHEEVLNRVARSAVPLERATNRLAQALEGNLMLDQPNNTPTLGVREIHPPNAGEWFRDLQPLSEREQIIQQRAFMEGVQEGRDSMRTPSVDTSILQLQNLPCIISSRGDTFINLTFLRMGHRTWSAQQIGDELRLVIEPLSEEP